MITWLLVFSFISGFVIWCTCEWSVFCIWHPPPASTVMYLVCYTCGSTAVELEETRYCSSAAVKTFHYISSPGYGHLIGIHQLEAKKLNASNVNCKVSNFSCVCLMYLHTHKMCTSNNTLYNKWVFQSRVTAAVWIWNTDVGADYRPTLRGKPAQRSSVCSPTLQADFREETNTAEPKKNTSMFSQISSYVEVFCSRSGGVTTAASD